LRERTASEIRREAERTNFRGYCQPCAAAAVRDGTHRWRNYRKGQNRTEPRGYRFVLPSDVPDDLLPIYRAMQRSGQPVSEHRWAMAKKLGRPLMTHECVDHMDGDKANNDPSNLRIYLRGKQQPGSCPGYGSYYHEWQSALARIAELETLLKH
jgi:hypothetical protein